MSEIESNLSLFAELPFHMLETAVDGASTADRIATMLETFTVSSIVVFDLALNCLQDSHPHAHIMDHAAYNNAPGTERVGLHFRSRNCTDVRLVRAFNAMHMCAN